MNTNRMTTVPAMCSAILILVSATTAMPAHSQQDEAQSQDPAATRAAFSTACDKAMVSHQTVIGQYQGTGALTYFGQVQDRRNRIQSLEVAVQKRRDALRIGVDPVDREIQTFQKIIMQSEATLRRLGGTGHESRQSQEQRADWVADEECYRRYVAFLQSIAAPSLEIMKQELAQASDSRIEQQRQARETQYKAADESAAEQTRERKEADFIAEQAEKERQLREVAAAAVRQKEANEAAATALRLQAQRTAEAEAAAAEQKTAAENAAALAKLQMAEQAALESRRQAEVAAREEQERPAREAAVRAAQVATAEARSAAEKLPTCTDAKVLETVKEGVANSPAGKVVGLRVLGIEDARDGYFPLDVEHQKRNCSANLLTTGGTIVGNYTIRWTNKDRDEIWVETELQPQ
jgi:hypothetical protein